MDLIQEPPKKRRPKSSNDNCVMCHLPLNADCLFVKTPTLEGLKAIIHAAEICKDDIYEQLSEVRHDVLNQTVTIRYHTKCRAWYTSTSILKYVQNKHGATGNTSSDMAESGPT